MSNNVLVKNSTYYSSSLKEGSSKCVINNMEFYDISRDYQILVDTSLSNVNKLKDVKANCHTVNIIDGTTKEEFEDPFTIKYKTEVGMVNDLVEKQYVDYPIFTQNINQNGFSITIVKEEEIIKDAEISMCLVSDNVSDEEYIGECFSPTEIFVKDFSFVSTLNDCEARKLILNKTVIKKDYETIESIFAGTVKKMTRDYIPHTKMSIVIQAPPEEEAGYSSQPVIEMDVANSYENGDGNNDGPNTGGDLNNLVFTIQQMSFFEFKLNFKEKKVVDVFNLPQGLFFDIEGQRIVGTPILSGRYGFALIFDNNSTLNGTIEVPKVKREM